MFGSLFLLLWGFVPASSTVDGPICVTVTARAAVRVRMRAPVAAITVELADPVPALGVRMRRPRPAVGVALDVEAC